MGGESEWGKERSKLSHCINVGGKKKKKKNVMKFIILVRYEDYEGDKKNENEGGIEKGGKRERRSDNIYCETRRSRLEVPFPPPPPITRFSLHLRF